MNTSVDKSDIFTQKSREFTQCEDISKETLSIMDGAMQNYRLGKVSAPIDFNEDE